MQSDLVGLRAELHKKQVEASKFGAGRKALPKRSREKSSKSTSFNISNAGVIARDIKDKEQERRETPSEETAREILEKKAQLYDKLHGGIETLEDDILNDKYLVNFQRKIVDEVTDRKKLKKMEEDRRAQQKEQEESQPEDYKAWKKDEEWVEYTDVLGRTRECMRKDLPAMIDKDKNLLGEDKDEAEREAELISGEEYREKLRQKWEQEEELNAFKKDLHYQDVTYNEARMHGTGFMKFSQDEKKRKAQMDMLKEMHNEAVTAEHTKKIAASKKQKSMQERLEKVRQRKRLKLGLPMKDDDKFKTPPASDDEEETLGPPLPTQNTTPEDAAKETELKTKRPNMREWDVGKQGMKEAAQEEWVDRQRKDAAPLSQQEWVDRQRKQRKEEFAPPSTYVPGKRHRPQNFTKGAFQEPTASRSSYHNEETHEEEKRNEFAPPSTFEYYGPTNFSSRHGRGKVNYKTMKNSIDRGLANLRNASNQ